MNRKISGNALVLLAALVSGGTLQAAPGDVLWQQGVGANIGSSVAVDEANGRLFVGNAGGEVLALSASTHEVLWRTPTDAAIGASPALSRDGTRLFVANYDGDVMALDTTNGAVLWTYPVYSLIYASAALTDDGAVVVGTKDGLIVSLDAATGVERWRYNAGAEIGTSAAVNADGDIYFGTGAGKVLALTSAGSLRWQYTVAGNQPVTSPIIGPNGWIYVSGYGSAVIALDRAGVKKWSVAINGRAASSLALDGNGILYATTLENSTLFAINTATQALSWQLPLGDGEQSFATTAVDRNGTIYVATMQHGKVFAVTASGQTPTVAWQYDSPDNFIASPTLHLGKIYLPSLKGDLYAVDTGDNTLTLADRWSHLRFDLINSGNPWDTDGDGMPDAWERQYNLDPWLNNASADADNDGISNLNEYRRGLVPNVADTDTDGDGIANAWETRYGLNTAAAYDAALDADGDGVSNRDEYIDGTDPLDDDSYLQNTQRVRVQDLLKLQQVLIGAQTLSVEEQAYYDINDDAVIDQKDLLIFQRLFYQLPVQ